MYYRDKMAMTLFQGHAPSLAYPQGAWHSLEMVADLLLRAYRHRTQVLHTVCQRQTEHIGSAFSIAQALVARYLHHLRLDPAQPDGPIAVRPVFSEEHAVGAAAPLAKERVDARVVEVDTPRPLDRALIAWCSAEVGAVVSVKGHCIISGLDDAVPKRCPRSRPSPWGGSAWQTALLRALRMTSSRTSASSA
jgi:hypothetical protein